MKILINAISAKSGGALTFIKNFVKGVSNARHDNNYIIYVSGAFEELEPYDTNRITIIKSEIGNLSGIRQFIWVQKNLRRILKKARADVLISSSDFGLFFPPCHQILLVRNALYFSSQYKDIFYPDKSFKYKVDFNIRKLLVILSCLCSDVIMVASEYMRDELKHIYLLSNKQIIVNHFGLVLDKFFSNKHTRDTDCKFIKLLYVSEYGDYKNLTNLLKAVARVNHESANKILLYTTMSPDDFPDVEVNTRDIDKQLLQEDSIKPYVVFWGKVAYEHIEHLYFNADIFIFPSLVESFGHPLIEAMASGLPVIASDLPIMHEICEDAAIYFNPLDYLDISLKIQQVVSDNNIAHQMKSKGIKLVEDRYHWDKYITRFHYIIDEYCKV